MKILLCSLLALQMLMPVQPLEASKDSILSEDQVPEILVIKQEDDEHDNVSIKTEEEVREKIEEENTEHEGEEDYTPREAMDTIVVWLDSEDFVLTDYIEVKDDSDDCRVLSYGEYDLTELGIYPLKLIAVDKNGNSISKNVAVEVVEEPAPDPYVYWSYDEIVNRLNASGVGVGGDAYAIAESLIGMGGYCTDVANTFLALYFGDGSNCFDTYDIDPSQAQPGDVVFYSDGGTGYQHYAIYLGGEMSLQGNWLGTTIIRSVFINGSAPQFRRCSGH
ncbi:MAG: C40 family peptidase [Erysipelotrichaceae bacterium]|nr:C40 family peptidase [Erysipelotrichaceae bacterium]